jgi:hypothetical protein
MRGLVTGGARARPHLGRAQFRSAPFANLSDWRHVGDLLARPTSPHCARGLSEHGRGRGRAMPPPGSRSHTRHHSQPTHARGLVTGGARARPHLARAQFRSAPFANLSDWRHVGDLLARPSSPHCARGLSEHGRGHGRAMPPPALALSHPPSLQTHPRARSRHRRRASATTPRPRAVPQRAVREPFGLAARGRSPRPPWVSTLRARTVRARPRSWARDAAAGLALSPHAQTAPRCPPTAPRRRTTRCRRR